MSQRPLDLLPDSIRQRTQTVVRTGRYIAALLISAAVLLVLTTHARLELDRAKVRLAQAKETADMVIRTENRARELRADLVELDQMIKLHERLALPVQASALLATLVNRLPPSISLDRIEMNVQTSRSTRRAASLPRGVQSQAVEAGTRRTMTGEISGFAASDEDIAVLIAALRETPPLDSITLDFSRTRTIRGHGAREFRMSFRIDLDSIGQVVTSKPDVQPRGYRTAGF